MYLFFKNRNRFRNYLMLFMITYFNQLLNISPYPFHKGCQSIITIPIRCQYDFKMSIAWGAWPDQACEQQCFTRLHALILLSILFLAIIPRLALLDSSGSPRSNDSRLAPVAVMITRKSEKETAAQELQHGTSSQPQRTPCGSDKLKEGAARTGQTTRQLGKDNPRDILYYAQKLSGPQAQGRGYELRESSADTQAASPSIIQS